MLKFKLIILAILLSAVAHAQKQTPVPDQAKLLIDAYKTKSNDKLLKFFTNWQNEIPTVSNSELTKMDNRVREAYKVFTAFYQLKKIKSLGGFRNNIVNFYDDAKFLVIQNSLVVHTTDRLYWSPAETDSIVVETYNKTATPGYLKKTDPERHLSYYELSLYGPTGDKLHLDKINDKLIDTLKNFRPAIDVGDKLPVYLNDKYRDLLHSFLGESNVVYATGYPDSERKNQETLLRHQFVETQIKILKWGGDHLCSEPYVTKITFDKNMKYAKVNYEIWTEGGEAILRNDNGKWIIQSARALWIQ